MKIRNKNINNNSRAMQDLINNSKIYSKPEQVIKLNE